jgi:hypothetical protein
LPKDGKVLSHLGFKSNVLPGLKLTEVTGWDSAPQAHSRVSDIDFDIWILGEGALYIFHEKLSKYGKVLSHLGFETKVLPGP